MNDEDVDAAVKLTDTMDTLKRVSGGMFRQIGVQLIPVVQRFSDKIIENAPRIKSEVLPVISKLVNGLSWAVEHLSGTGLVIGGTMVAFGGLSVAIGKTLDSFVSIGTGIRNFHKFMEVHRFTAEVKAINMIPKAFENVGNGLWAFGDKITGLGTKFPKLANGFNLIGNAITKLGISIGMNPIGAIITALVVGAVLIFKYWKPIKAFFVGVGEGLKTSLAPVLEVLKPFKPLFDGIINAIKKLFTPVDTAGKVAHNMGVEVGKLIGGFVRIGAVVWMLSNPIGWLVGITLIVAKNFDKIKNAVVGAGNALKNFFSKFGNKGVNVKVAQTNEQISGGNVKTKVDGSHANGLNYVPFNGYTAELHKGERVLTAQENKQYNSSTNTPIYVTFSPVINADSNTDTSSIAKIVERECNKLIAKIQEQQRRRLVGAYA